MPLSKEAYEKKKKYNKEYNKKNYKRISLDVSVDKYEQIKEVASSVGESMNGYIKKSIDTRIAGDTKRPPK